MKKSYLMLHIAVLLAGFTGVFGKLIALNEFCLVWYRVLFSTLILFLGLKLLKIDRLKSSKEAFRIARVGLLLTIHWIFFYASIKYSNISIGVVCYCLTSFFTAIFEPLLNRKRFRVLQLLLSALTLIGISLIFHFDTSYGKLLNYYQMFGGTLGLGILFPIYFYLYPNENFIPSGRDTFYLVLLASFCTVGLYVLFAESLRKLSAFTVNLSFNLEPIYAIAIAFLFFKEGREVNISFYFGLSFVLLSVILQSVISIRSKK